MICRHNQSTLAIFCFFWFYPPCCISNSVHKLQLLKVKAHVCVCIRDVGAVGAGGSGLAHQIWQISYPYFNQQGWQIMPTTLLLAHPFPGFSDHHTALCTYECVCGHPTSKQSPKFYATFLARLDGGTMGP